MKVKILALVALAAIVLNGCTGGNPLTPPPTSTPVPPTPAPTMAPPPPTPVVVLTPFAPAPPAPAPPAPAPAPQPGPGGTQLIGGVPWMPAGPNKFSSAGGGCFEVPANARVDTPQGSFFGGESVTITVATFYPGEGTNASQPRRQCNVSQANPALAPPAAPQPAQAAEDPSKVLGGNWRHAGGNKWTLTAPATIRGAAGWVIHTPQHPGDPGLPAGESENTPVATAYRVP